MSHAAYRIGEYLFLVRTHAEPHGSQARFRSEAYVLVIGDELRLVRAVGSGPFECVASVAQHARDGLLHRLTACLGTRAHPQAWFDPSGHRQLGTWELPA